jgi:hypothetical protein
MYITRKILLPELQRLNMAHPDFEDSGWAVCRLVGDEESVIDWFADRYAAVEEAGRLNEEDDSR